MHIKSCCISLILLLYGTVVAHSQEYRTEISVDFRVNRTDIEPDYGDNAIRLNEIWNLIQNLKEDDPSQIIEVAFCGAASPEGSYELNRRLANGRLTALEEFVRRELDIPENVIIRNDSYIPWSYLRKEISRADIPYKQEILDILDADSTLVDYHRDNQQIDGRIKQLQQLEDGKAWRLLMDRFFAKMRSSSAIFLTRRKPMQPKPVAPPVFGSSASIDNQIAWNVVPAPVLEQPAPVVEEQWRPSLYVKSNGIGWLMLIGNAAVEADICQHFSFTLPVYYSALNYFTRTLKFRTFAIQPELRYWFSPENNGWFVGAHFGLAYYNYAVKGDWRIQDHNRETPAIGGGVSGGYRMPLGKKNRWHLEFTLGAGVYPVHYDKFHNERNGLLYETKKKTFVGVDNAAVTLAYRFDLKKEGGK